MGDTSLPKDFPLCLYQALQTQTHSSSFLKNLSGGNYMKRCSMDCIEYIEKKSHGFRIRVEGVIVPSLI